MRDFCLFSLPVGVRPSWAAPLPSPSEIICLFLDYPIRSILLLGWVNWAIKDIVFIYANEVWKFGNLNWTDENFVFWVVWPVRIICLVPLPTPGEVYPLSDFYRYVSYGSFIKKLMVILICLLIAVIVFLTSNTSALNFTLFLDSQIHIL